MATNDEMRLKMTVSKMNVHRSTKLETIAVKCIARNLDSFLSPKYSETRNVKLLPSALRNIVFQQWLMRLSAQIHKPQKPYRTYDDCIKIYQNRMNVFQSLVSCHTLEVDLTPFMKDKLNFLARKHLLKYLDLFGGKATNLKVLNILACYQDCMEPNNSLCNAIGKLHNLKSLNIGHIEVGYANLKAMCTNLESLTHLCTRIHFNPNFDESNQREIEDLQIFSNLIVFKHGGSIGQNKFTINCIQRLPKLQYIDSCTTSIVEELLDRCPNQKFALTEMTLSARSNKEIHLSFPKVTNLEISYPDSDDFINPNSLLKFSKIENLTLTNFCLADTTMIPFLDAYGHSLHSLSINYCRGQFKISSILDRCPKLQSLFLYGVSILPECSRPEIHSFSTGLKEFEWKFPRHGIDGQVPSLLDILSVPTLECVTLRMDFDYFLPEDIEKLTAMIASRQILRNLKRLCIFVYYMEMDSNHVLFRALSNFIKSASAFLPHLTDLETNILSNVLVRNNSEASLAVATLKTFIDVYGMYIKC